MACSEYEKQLEVLEDYASGALTDPEAEKIRGHLETCALCRDEVEVARAGGELLRAAFPSSPGWEPDGPQASAFWYRVRAGLSAAGGSASGGDFWRTLEWMARRLAWTAALVVALLGGYTVLAHQLSDGAWRESAARSEAASAMAEELAQQPSDNEEALLTLAERGR